MGNQKVSTEQVIEHLKANRWHRMEVARLLGVCGGTIKNHLQKAVQMGIEVHPSGYDASKAKLKGSPPVVGQSAGTGDFAKPITHFPKENREDPFRSPVSDVPVDPERLQKVEPFEHRIGIHIAEGNLEAARRLVDVAFAELSDRSLDIQPLASTSITDVGIPARTENILIEEHGVRTLGDLLHIYSVGLLATPNFGTKSLDTVWRSVLNHCFKQDGKLRARLTANT